MKKGHLFVGASAIAAVAAVLTLRHASITEVAQQKARDGDSIVAVQMPNIQGNAAVGQRIFDASCASCHGANAVGAEGAGPPLIHKIYEPSHHADESFHRAVVHGVKSHHWQFGDMPPVEGLTQGDVAMVIAYIREIQRANGIN